MRLEAHVIDDIMKVFSFFILLWLEEQNNQHTSVMEATAFIAPYKFPNAFPTVSINTS